MELKVYDIVKIVEGNGSVYSESINVVDYAIHYAYTDNFIISLETFKVSERWDNKKAFQLDMVWRLDEHGNYIIIYPVDNLNNPKDYEATDGLECSIKEPLETLEKLKDHLKYEWLDDFANTQYYNTIKQALQRLEAIENINTSEALENIKEFINNTIFAKDLKEQKDTLLKNIDTIKQTLLKAQEQEKVLEIIFKKQVKLLDLEVAIHNNSLRLYNGSIQFNYLRLTKEEFDLLKRWKECQKN